MQFLADETITASVGIPTTLTAALIDQTGAGRAQRAVIYNIDEEANTPVALRYVQNPGLETLSYRPLAPGEEITIEGYENLRDLRITAIGEGFSRLFVQYFN